MKKRVLVVFAVISSLFISSIAPVFALLRSEPIPRAPIDVREMSQTDLFTGSASYSYPIKVPKGTNGLTPDVSLSYNSSAAYSATSYAGIGWDLNQEYIERDVNFTPGSTSDDTFKLHFKGAIQDLVYVSGDGRYHTKIESNLYITKETIGEANDYNEYWQVITPDGTKYRFGQGTNSEQVCNGRSYVYRWNLDQVEDRHTNKIFYTYTENSGSSYVTNIEYNTERSRVIDFTYTTNPYQRQVYVQGCNVTDVSRFSNIQINKENSFVLNDKTSNGNILVNTGVAGATTSTPFAASTIVGDMESTESDYLVAGDSTSLSGTGNSTLEAWVKFESLPSSGSVMTLLSKWAQNNYSYRLIMYNDSGTMTVQAEISKNGGNTGSDVDTVRWNWSPTTGTWYHVALTNTVANAAASEFELFVNGSSQGNGSVLNNSSVTSVYDGIANVEIGRVEGGSYFDGLIDEVRVWNTVRTGAEINNNKSAELAGNESGLVAYYPFEHLGFVDSSSVREYDFAYDTATNSAQLLRSITEVGGIGTTSALPATRFAYKAEYNPISVTSQTWLDDQNLDADLDQDSTTVADVNGDGMLDIVKTVKNGTPNTTWKVLLNQGSSWSGTYQNWVNNAPMEDARLDRSDVRLVDVTGDTLPDIVMSSSASSWKVWRNTGSKWDSAYESWGNLASYGSEHYLGDGRVSVVDVTGDGLADVVSGVANNWRVFKNLGNEWNGTPETWNTSLSQALNDTSIGVTDANGDGLPDIVRTAHSGTNATWYVYKNNGTSWSSSSETWIDNANVNAWLGKDEVSLADANGDSLVDIIKVQDNFGEADTWDVLYNTGAGWSTTAKTWISSSSNVGLDTRYVMIADATGDGMAEVIDGHTNCAGCGRVTWQVFKNNTVAPVRLSKVITSQGGSISFDYEKSATVSAYTMDAGSYSGQYYNNTSLSGSPALTRTDSSLNFEWGGSAPDGAINADNFSVRWTKTVSLEAGGYTFTTLVDDGARIYIDNELILDKWFDQGPTVYSVSKPLTAGSHTIVYEYYEHTGGAYAKFHYYKNPLPFPLWLVDRMTVDNGMTNSHQTNDVTTYEYQNGYYDWQEKEFRGFGTIIETLPSTAKRTYVFNQDDSLKGKLSSTQTNDTENIPYAKVENSWSMASSSGVFTVNLAEEKQYTYDGATASAKVKETEYTYDSYGNVTKISELGDTSISTDDRFTYNEYTASTSAWLVNTLKHTYKNVSDDSTKVSETYLYYDQHSVNSDAPHFGDVTKEVKWLSGGTNPETNYTYDSYGNVATVRDANNHTTTYTYDTTKTYPATVSNAKNQTTTYSYDVGTGNLLSVTDPNSLTTSYEYDVFGRIIKEIKPYDSSSYPSVSYQYFWDGVAPESTLVSKRETASSAATLDVYTHVDGLGRKIQTRSDAENTIHQIVTNTFYDPTGEVLSQTVPHVASTSAVYATPLSDIRGTEMTYDVLGRVTMVENPKGDYRTTAYDHWKVTGIDEKGSIKRNFLNAFDKITKVEEVLGATTSATLYTYNARDDLTQITDDASNVFSFTYDTLSRKTAQTDPDMGTWSYGYDAASNLTSTIDARSITTTRSYDALNRLTGVNYPTDTDTSYLYDSGKIGTLSIATDSAGTVAYTYDNRLRKIQEARTIGGTTKTTQFAFDAADRLTTQTNPDSTTASYTFNAQGEIESLTDIVDNVDYNALGKITKKDFDNGVTTNYTYNTDDFRLNRIQTLRQAQGLFDKNYAYDAVGNIATMTNNLTSKLETFTYDDLDRLKTATESAGLGPEPVEGFNYAYDYNSIGNLVTFTASGSATQYTYGSGSAYIKPHALTAVNGGTSSSSASYVFYKGVNFNGNAVTIEGNLWASMSGALSNGLSVPSGYNSASTGVTPDPAVDSDTDDMLNTAIWKSNTPLNINQTLDNGTYQVYFWVMENYQNNNRKIDVELENTQVADDIGYLPFGDWVKYGPYNVTVSDGTLNVELINAMSSPHVMGMALYKEESTPPPPPAGYNFLKGTNFNGNAVTIEGNSWQSMSTALSNGMSVPSGYTNATTSLTPSPAVDSDTNGMLNTAIWKSNAPLTIDQTLSNGIYQLYFWVMENYQSNNRKIDVELENTQVADDIGELTVGSWVKYGPYTVTVNDGTLNIELINSMDSPHVMGMAIYQAASASAGTTTYTYDNNGNMLSDGLKLYEYNEANQLKRVKLASNSATLAEYVYDFEGNRMIKRNYTGGVLSNTVYSWSDSFETKVIEGGGTETTVYYFANKELVAKKKNDGTRQYIHTDHLGSTSVVTNQAGTLVESTSYDPWGEVLSGGTQSKFGYTGQEHDSETGLDYYNFRYYNSDIRRFAQPDDIIQDVYSPQTLNRYSYVQNNPLRYTDPTGHVAVVPVILLGAGIGGLAGIADVALTNPNAGWQDYASAGVTGAGVGVATTLVTLAATPVAATGLGAVGVSGTARIIGADAIIGGLISGGKQTYSNIRNNKPFLQNVPQAIAAGSATAGFSSYGANKIIPQAAGRPSEKLSVWFNGPKSVQHTQRFGVSEFAEKLTLPMAAKVVSNDFSKTTTTKPNNKSNQKASSGINQYLKWR